MSDCGADAAFAHFLGTLDESLPPPARAAAAQHTLETCACLFAGTDIDEMQPILRSYARPLARAAVPGTDVRSEPSLAAGAIAALAHAAELDPIHTGTVICPAAVTVSAAFAIAQTTQLTGPRYIAAICAGYEAAIRLGRALDGAALLSKGWWPTAVCGGVAAAVTAGVCMRLTGEALQDAIGLAALHIGGLAIGGPTTAVARNLLCAHTVRAGVDAALAAASGVRGPRDLFSGARNILTAFGSTGDAAPMHGELRSRWAILETSLKRWPCALQAQSALDALATLAHRPGAATEIQAVEISLPAAMLRIVDRPEEPRSRWAAAASMQFLAAALLLDGEILDWRLEFGRHEPRVLDLMRRVRVRADAALDDDYPREWPARVRLRDSTGELTSRCSIPPGHPARPLPFEASEARFRHRAARYLSAQAVQDTVEFARTLERQSDLGSLVALLQRRNHPRPATAGAASSAP